MGMTIDDIIDFINRLTEFEGTSRGASPPSLSYFMDIDGFGKFKYAMKKAFPNVTFEFMHADERVFSFSNPIMHFGSVSIKYRHKGKIYRTNVALNLNAPIEYNIGKLCVKMEELIKSSQLATKIKGKVFSK